MEKNINKVTGLQNDLHNLADELSQLVIREHQILQGEISQMRVLVSDAVKRLESNFHLLNTRVSEQAAIIEQVVESGHVDDVQQRKLSKISNGISSCTSTTIRVLQFDDIVQQLAGHTCDRIARMQELFTELEAQAVNIKKLEVMDKDGIRKYIKMMHDEIERSRVKLEKENPVRQNSMSEGKIELF